MHQRRRELDLQKDMVDLIKSKGGLARICAQTPYTTIGDPDIYGCYKGWFFVIEVKEGDEQPTDIQCRRLLEWSNAGALTGVMRHLHEVENMLKEIDRRDSRKARR